MKPLTVGIMPKTDIRGNGSALRSMNQETPTSTAVGG